MCGDGLCSKYLGNFCLEIGDGDFDCMELCNESIKSCMVVDLLGLFCNDGLVCIVGDACNVLGNCVLGVSLCLGKDGDGDCSETCNDENGECIGSDFDGSICGDDGNSCIIEVCFVGECVVIFLFDCCVNDG